MSDRFQDTNWRKHGNPNRDEWFRTPRMRRDLPIDFRFLDYSDDSRETKISLWTIFWVIAVLLLLSGVSETVRSLVYEGRTWADLWYSGVDNLLDALGAPKLP